MSTTLQDIQKAGFSFEEQIRFLRRSNDVEGLKSLLRGDSLLGVVDTTQEALYVFKGTYETLNSPVYLVEGYYLASFPVVRFWRADYNFAVSGGFNWGYRGTGPRGTVDALIRCGLIRETAEKIIFSPYSADKPWQIIL